MKRIVLIGALVAVTSVLTDASAQVLKSNGNSAGHDGWNNLPIPHKSIKPHRTPVVSYDAASTVLTVKFSSHSHGGVVEVYRDGAKVAGITANSGTTFCCVLREYGTGNYNVIVSIGNTVVDSKNYTVQ